MLAPKPMKLINLSKMLKIKETEPELINILSNVSQINLFIYIWISIFE